MESLRFEMVPDFSERNQIQDFSDVVDSAFYKRMF
jgi:hypothetical protein